MNEDDLEELNERVKEMKLSVLFEEPCPLYEEDESDG
jgi:hypothetical protein